MAAGVHGASGRRVVRRVVAGVVLDVESVTLRYLLTAVNSVAAQTYRTTPVIENTAHVSLLSYLN